MKSLLVCALAAALLAIPLAAQDKKEAAPTPKKAADLTGYKTVAELIKADPKIIKPLAANVRPLGYLGLQVGEANGRPIVEEIEPDSPADKAGAKAGDVLVKVGETTVASGTAARDAFRGRFAGDVLAISVTRNGKPTELNATLRAVSRPMTASTVTLGFGARVRESTPGEVFIVTEGSPAEKAGMKVNDALLKVDGKTFDGAVPISDLLSERKVGDEIVVEYKRDGKNSEVRVKLVEETPTFGGRGGGGGGRGGAGGPGQGGRGGPGGGGAGRGGAGGWDDRLPRAWAKKTYNLAVIGIEYSDVKHNPKITDKDWENSLFSIGSYKDKSATGQPVHGSMNDYYKEISYGNFKVDGKFVGWVELPKKRMDYSTGSGSSNAEKVNYFNEALDKLLAQKGKDALKDFDGIFILFAGGRTGTTRGSLYWPHRSNFTHRATQKSWPYFIVNEMTGANNADMTNISVFCHEFGHMLGLPDLYARPEQPGMEGVGVWCAMSQQSPGGRPQHFSAWSKEQLSWIKPTLIDPRVKQKVVLSPIEDDPTQCLKVIVRTDASEYFLLENRQKKGFDTSLPADGLLIWRVMPQNSIQKVYLEEAHGVEGPSGPRSLPGAVPFPSPANNAFTPFTTPSSKSVIGGGLDVFVTNVRRLPDGRMTFHIGYEFQ